MLSRYMSTPLSLQTRTKLLSAHQNLRWYYLRTVLGRCSFVSETYPSQTRSGIVGPLFPSIRPQSMWGSTNYGLRQQKRSYIFFPSSFTEFMRILRDTITPITRTPSSSEPSSSKLFVRLRRSKDQVLFKVHQATKSLVKLRTSVIQRSRALRDKQHQQQLLPSSGVRDWVQSVSRKFPLQHAQTKFLAMKKRAQQSIMGKLKTLSNKESLSNNWRHIYYSLLRKTLSRDPSSAVSDLHMIRDTIKPSSSYYKRKLMALRILLANPKLVLYSQQLFTLTEPFEPSWFDPDGYPLTSQDPHTLRYVNPWMSSSNGWKSLKDVWKWKKDRVVDMSTRPSQDPSIHPMIPRPIPPHQIDMGPPKDYEQKIKLTWIGHSTCLVHMSNQFTILTDPIFSNKASPFQKFGKKEFFGVARYFPPAVSIFDSDSMDSNHNDLPQLPAVIDVCLISHDHYDHLDYSSIEKLVDRVKFWVVPLGIKQWLLDNISRMDPSSIVELKWWDQVTLIRQDVSSAQHEVMLSTTGTPSVADVRGKSSITLTCAPAQHWSSRTPFDRNTRLWCSWAVHACIPSPLSKQDCMNKLGFFFAGDTARPETFPLHRQIGDRLGPFDLAALPIGAYEPRFFMKDSHCDPDEAVQIHHDLRSRKSVAIHWGTFPLANEPYWDPPLRLNQAVRKFQCEFTSDKIDFTAIGHGESIEAVGSDESSDVFQDLGYAESKQTLQLLLEERLDDEPVVK